jgi:hypothetical protein
MKPLFVTSLLAAIAGSAISPAAEKPTGPPPATVENARKESDLTTVTLTPLAEKRLAIELAPVEHKTITQSRTFGGEVITPLGTQGEDSIYQLFPNMTPTETIALAGLQVDADGLVEIARIDLEAVRVAFERTEGLFKDGAATEKDRDDARALLNLASATLAVAQKKRELLGDPVLKAGEAQTLWVRVPLYVGDMNRLKTDGEVMVGNLSARPGDPLSTAERVDVPAFAVTPGSAMADLYFVLENAGAKFRPGLRVGVAIPTSDSGETLAVPWSSIVTDINGGTWVYTNIAPQTYQRQRVQVRNVVDGVAALARGPKVGTKIATTGVAELFGTEFGVGK